MRIGVPKERLALETRAAATPKTVEQLLKLGFSVAVESGAGKLASFDDEAFVQAGAEIVSGDDVWQSGVILKVNAPDDEEILLLNPGTTLISFIWPAQNPQLMEKLAARNINVMAMDSVPRISRAQSLDALSSMANIAGYRAIVEAAHEFGRFFTGQITAAGAAGASLHVHVDATGQITAGGVASVTAEVPYAGAPPHRTHEVRTRPRTLAVPPDDRTLLVRDRPRVLTAAST